ncbi:MFS general substrate transporter, partial [Gonapodya prolifera JEL478]
LAMLIIARMLQGISAAAVGALGLALLGSVYPEDQLGKAYGIAWSGFLIGACNLTGLPIGGALYQHGGYWTPFIVTAGFIMCDMVARLLVRERRTTSTNGNSGLVKNAAEDSTTTSLALKMDNQELAPHTSQTSENHSNKAPNKKFLFPNMRWHALHKDNPTYYDLVRDPAVLLLSLFTATTAVVQIGLEPTLPIYMQKEFGSDSTTVGLVYLAIVSGCASLIHVGNGLISE